MRRQLLSLSRRRALQCGATLLGAGAGLPIAAGQAAGPVSAQPLRLVGPWEIGGLAPAQTGYLFQRLGVLETLLETGPEGQPRPGLAQRWQVSADGRLWQFWLAPGRRFHDGTPLLAERVLPSLQLAQRAPALLLLRSIRAHRRRCSASATWRPGGPRPGP
jgi:peptide/nickel transport system substrate-binding protein